jgi:Na+/H+-dicarboxylate symporter
MNRVGGFFLFIGFCTVFGGLMTGIGSQGTAAQYIAWQVSSNYIFFGLALILIGLIIVFAYRPSRLAHIGVAEKDQKSTNQATLEYCRYCGKHIPTTSAFCPYCERAQV